MKNGQQALPPFCPRHLLFRVRGWVKLPFRDRPIAFDSVVRSVVRMAPLQGKIVRDAKNPTPKVLARFPEPQVSKERQENLLNDLLPVMHGQTER